jgi:hypothetical protein
VPHLASAGVNHNRLVERLVVQHAHTQNPKAAAHNAYNGGRFQATRCAA